MTNTLKNSLWCSVALAIAFAIIAVPKSASAQDDDDPPGRVARLGYMQGSVSFQPAGESEWVGAVPNRPMSTGDQLWTDEDGRAEVQLGSAVIRLAPLTTFSFLNLDDDTVQIQLTSGAINITIRRLSDEDDFEVDTPNQAFTAFQPGHYRIEASANGDYTVISVRAGQGESTGNGQSFGLHAGQRGTFSGSDTDSLYADVEPLYGADEFDNWSDFRDHRYESSRSSAYLAPDVVGYEDLDQYGDWRDDSNYGHVWFPSQVAGGWAPYHEGHWDWISPWGWTWVDDSPWGYAPFHYGRWVSVGGRWGWVSGPVAVRAVYAPALVVFIGGGPGGFGGNVGWFPLGPREVYVPSYHVSQAYVNRVNISNTTVNVTQVTNVYNTTIINNTTNITHITYANRSVQGAVMVVPQHAFTSAQPVAKVAVSVSAQQIAAAPMSARVAVVPTHESVLGSRAATVGHVAAPPAAIANRQVVAKKTPPPPPVAFAKQQQALAAHPGQPLARSEVQTLRPAATAATRPMVKQAPPAKPATPNVGHPAPNLPTAARPAPAANQPMNRPMNQPMKQPPAPAANQPMNRPGNPPPANERPAVTAPSQPSHAPAPTPAPQPEYRPGNNRVDQTPNRPQPAQPEMNHPATVPPPPNNHPEPARPETTRPEPAPHPQTPPPSEHPPQRTPPPAATKPAPPPPAVKPAPQQKQKPQTPEEKKQEEERQKHEQKPQSN
jgi:hypothetical protein